MNPQSERMDEVINRLERIETAVAQLLQQRTVKEWYTTAEVAQIVGKAEFTVREWCRLGRVSARKHRSGRGAFPAWVISHEEIQRLQKEGLLPLNN